MRHEMTSIIALHSMVVLALLTIVPVSISEQGILAVPSFLGTAPTPDAIFSDGGVFAAGFYSFTLAVAGVLGTPATPLFRRVAFPTRISGRGRAR